MYDPLIFRIFNLELQIGAWELIAIQNYKTLHHPKHLGVFVKNMYTKFS